MAIPSIVATKALQKGWSLLRSFTVLLIFTRNYLWFWIENTCTWHLWHTTHKLSPLSNICFYLFNKAGLSSKILHHGAMGGGHTSLNRAKHTCFTLDSSMRLGYNICACVYEVLFLLSINPNKLLCKLALHCAIM